VCHVIQVLCGALEIESFDFTETMEESSDGIFHRPSRKHASRRLTRGAF